MDQTACRSHEATPDAPQYRQAVLADVEQIVSSRRADPGAEPRDGRLAAYLEGTHHPREALPPRVALIATVAGEVVGYIAGHLTRRHECEGEVQHLWVAPRYRRKGVGVKLLQGLGAWFVGQGARRVCVNVAPDNVGAHAFFRRLGAAELNQHWLVWAEPPRER